MWRDLALGIYAHIGIFVHMRESACGEQCVWAYARVCYGFLVCGGDGWGLNWYTAGTTPTDLSHIPEGRCTVCGGDGVWLGRQPAAPSCSSATWLWLVAAVGNGGAWEGFPNHLDWVKFLHIPLSQQPGEPLAFNTF